jgi:glucose/arabinose dehydrogenase
MHEPLTAGLSRRLRFKRTLGISLAGTAALLALGCGGGGGGSLAAGSSTSSPAAVPSAAATSGGTCSGTAVSTATDGLTPSAPALTVPAGRTIVTIASVPGARELAALPNGDLLVGTHGGSVYIVPNAESSGAAGAARVFATIAGESIPPGEPGGGNNAEGVAFSQSTCTVFIATEYHVWSTAYRDGDLQAEKLVAIATVRTGPTADPGDGDDHTSTSVAVSGSTVYAAMGSSCNGCTGESDPQRAAIWRMNLDGTGMTLLAKRFRNAIALAVNPASGHLWAAGAGQDSLPLYHPYEFADDVTASAAGGVADYGWPYCEENHIAYVTGAGAPADCSGTVQPLVEFPAYITHIGAAFYPAEQGGAYTLASTYGGALFIASHGSWHQIGGCTVAPEVEEVPMNGDLPKTPMTNWGVQQPSSQWVPFVTGFQPGCTQRIGRPTGIAVGAKGSIFIGDDQTGTIYRVR